MKSKVNLGLIIGSMLFLTVGCAHMGDPCDNKLLTRIPSATGDLILATYHRECSSKIYTTAALEKPAGFLRSQGEVVCHLMSWGDRHPIEAVWKNDTTISISTTDRLQKLDFEGSKDSCAGIKIDYRVQFRDERQQTTDSSIISKIKKALAETGSCINDYYKSANSANDPVADVNKMINNGEHRSAIENILGYTYSAKCSISPATYNSLKELSKTFDLKPEYLERVTPLIKH